MALTKTINYTQNVPISLGYTNELVGTATDYRSVTFDFLTPGSDYKMGQLFWTDTAGVTVIQQTSTENNTGIQNYKFEGELSAVNAILNTVGFVNHFYDADNITQDFLSQNRTLPDDHRGELCIQIPPDTVHGLTVGSVCRIKDVGRYVVTKIDSVNSPIRIWLAYRSDWDLVDLYYSPDYKNTKITSDAAGNTITTTGTVTKTYTTAGAYLQTDSAVNIAPIIDLAYANPHGDFTIIVTVFDINSTVLETATLTFVGSFFIAEPTFTVLPATLSAPVAESRYRINVGDIAQADENYQSVQVLFKYCENDPNYLNVNDYTQLSGYPSAGTDDEKLQFIGDAINAKAKLSIPTYIVGTAVGNLGVTQVGDRVAAAPETGIIRWHFYGTPVECNAAMGRIYYFRATGVTKDFNYEVRIVNGRTRIYSSRGK